MAGSHTGLHPCTGADKRAINAAVAQSVEHSLGKGEVDGSSPFSSTISRDIPSFYHPALSGLTLLVRPKR